MGKTRHPQILLFLCFAAVTVAGCGSVQVGEHKVSPAVAYDLHTPPSEVQVAAIGGAFDVERLSQAINEGGVQAQLIDGSAFMCTLLGDVQGNVSLDRFQQADARAVAARFNID